MSLVGVFFFFPHHWLQKIKEVGALLLLRAPSEMEASPINERSIPLVEGVLMLVQGTFHEWETPFILKEKFIFVEGVPCCRNAGQGATLDPSCLKGFSI